MSDFKKVPTTLKRVPITFLGVMALLVLALGWLGWLLLEQDVSLQEQRMRVRVDTAVARLEDAFANGIVAERENLKKIAAILNTNQGTDLSAAVDLLQTQNIYLHFSPDGMKAMPEVALRYLPIPEQAKPLYAEFEQIDRLEFQQQDYSSALGLLQPLAASPDKKIQAAALIRLGRIDRRNGRINEALRWYQALSELRGQKVASVPAEWIGRYARCSIFEAENKLPELGIELGQLVHTLGAGGHKVAASTYRFYVEAVTKWTKLVAKTSGSEPLKPLHAPSEMAADFFNTWSDLQLGGADEFGVQTGGADSEHLLGVWTAFESDLLVSIIGFDRFAETSLAAIIDELQSKGIGWRIADATGQALLASGPNPGDYPSSLRPLVIGGITLTVTTFATQSMAPDPDDITRRRLLLTGLLLILLIILASTYFISRSLRRETQISQLQSDFVAAVSHEFRTPLTSIRQLTELLASGRVENKEKITAYYRILQKESARLQRLVEGLLDFGRMEAGAHRYQPKSLNCSALLEDVGTAFREEYDLTTAQLSLEIEGMLPVQIDRESLTRAIWNLLDNAVKYSPDTVKIEIRARLKNDKVSISVADQGVGITAHEQSEIFNKFVRGSAARVTHSKGTGMGLAMVRRIIEDQGGEINVRNKPDGGSVFTILLPSTEPQ